MFISSFLKLLGLTVIDNRPARGNLWVVASKDNFTPISNALASKGIYFYYKIDGAAVRKYFGQNTPAWWTTYNEHPIKQRQTFGDFLQELIASSPMIKTNTTPEPPKIVSVKSKYDNGDGNVEIKKTCPSCAHIHDCNDAFRLFSVGCDEYILSLAHRNIYG